jgi:hypothetical protein
MSTISIASSAFVTNFSLGLLFVSILSYRRHKNVKLLFVCVVFLLFLIKGIILSLGLIYEEELSSIVSSVIYTGLFDLLVLILLFAATLRR